MNGQLTSAAMIAAGAFLAGWICHYCVAAIHHDHHHHPKGHQ